MQEQDLSRTLWRAGASWPFLFFPLFIKPLVEEVFSEVRLEEAL